MGTDTTPEQRTKQAANYFMLKTTAPPNTEVPIRSHLCSDHTWTRMLWVQLWLLMRQKLIRWTPLAKVNLRKSSLLTPVWGCAASVQPVIDGWVCANMAESLQLIHAPLIYPFTAFFRHVGVPSDHNTESLVLLSSGKRNFWKIFDAPIPGFLSKEKKLVFLRWELCLLLWYIKGA